MNQFKIVLSVLLSILLFTPVAQSVDCSKELKTVKAGFFSNPRNKTVWISLSQPMDEKFKALGFLKAEAPKKIENFVQCLGKSDRQKSFNSQDGFFTLFVGNACEEKFATALSFKKFEIENYGSMEAGLVIRWDEIGVCSDGKGLKHCPPSSPKACTNK